nr:hypothetical protein CFP56_29862 [Quercus suber]
MALVDMDPDDPGQVPRGKNKLRPILAAFRVAFVGRGRTKGEGQAHDEAGDSEQHVADTYRVDELADALDRRRPQRQEQQGQ